MEIKNFLKHSLFNRLPLFLQTTGLWQRITRIEKPFSEIGLLNFTEPCDEIIDGVSNYHIGFTSLGIQGIWDLATMSMRGVCSCMHWENPVSYQLVGSIADPFLGMVYITDNTKTSYGPRLVRRALVRFVHDPIKQQNALMLERPYVDTGNTNPKIYANREKDPRAIINIYEKFLRKHLKVPYDIYTARGSCYIPISTSSTFAINLGQTSMRDSQIGYKECNSDAFIAKFAQQI